MRGCCRVFLWRRLLICRDVLEQYDGRFAFRHDAEPDEAWMFAEYGLPVLTLCVPVKGELHNDAGVLLRTESALEYCNVLSLLANVLR